MIDATDAIKREPVRGPALWTAGDLAEKDWVWRLESAEQEELDRALEDVKGRGLRLGEFGPREFALPRLAPKLAAIRSDVVDGKRFALLRGVKVEGLSVQDLELVYWGIGSYLGAGLGQNAHGDLLTHVTFHDLDPSNPNVRGYQDRRHQEPHNDLADMVGLLCIRKAKSGGASSIVNMAAAYNAFLARRPDLLPIMYRGFYRDYRGEGADPSSTTPYRVPIFAHEEGRLTCFYGRRGIDATFKKKGVAPSREEEEALALMDELILAPEFRLDMELQAGDIQLVNNYAVLHARTAYDDYDDPGRWRLLLRLWLNLAEAKPPESIARFTRRGFEDVARA
ncbi:MAG: TauD/TfdA family dioxygenase [Hyphomonadaceae bacterium]|nr:TauD/TfdA family dioxygenase [Hyphomonadaceae bacterium]